MARYRSKDETDLIWNQIRRQITRDLDTALMNRREAALDKLLTKAWEEFTTALQSGDVKMVEAKYSQFASEIVQDLLPEGMAAGAVVDG
jgi:hypothetical protein